MLTSHGPDTLDRRVSGTSSSSTSRLALDKVLPPEPKPSADEMTSILVGSKQRSFQVNQQRLCQVSPFFRERLEDPFHSKTISLWLPNESSAMFALFVEWVHSPSGYRNHIDDAVAAAHETGERASKDVHWAIVHLHLFASQLSLHSLQDLAMDAIQDLYLKFDWDVPPGLVVYLYTECEALPAMRLRRWAVAMAAFSLAVGCQLRFHPHEAATSDPDQLRALLDSLPEFRADYAAHLDNMAAAGHDVRLKNPQLRISANRLRNEERLFGFRECSFHSHRGDVGEALCPHAAARGGGGGRAVSAPDLRWSRNGHGRRRHHHHHHRNRLRSGVSRSLFSWNSSERLEKRLTTTSIAQSIASTFSE